MGNTKHAKLLFFYRGVMASVVVLGERSSTLKNEDRNKVQKLFDSILYNLSDNKDGLSMFSDCELVRRVNERKRGWLVFATISG